VSVGERDIARVSRSVPSARPPAAGTVSEKKNQRCAPAPERERSTAGARPSSLQTSRSALTSAAHVSPSRSIASTQHVSSAKSG